MSFILSSIAFFVFPLLIIYQDISKLSGKNKVITLKTAFEFVFLCVIFLMSRFFFILMTSLLTAAFSYSGVITLIDLLYWIFIKNQNYLINEHLLWKLVWFYFAEVYIVITIFFLIIGIWHWVIY